MPVIAISTSTFGAHDPTPIDALGGAGFEVRLNPHGRRLEPAETRTLLAGAVGLIAGTERLDREVLASAPGLRAIARCGSGLDNLDLEAAAELGVAVSSTPEAPAEAVAELALAGILDLMRHLARADRDLRRGVWQKPMGHLLGGRSVGLVGLGRVGRRLVELLAPFGCRILATDPAPDRPFGRRHGVRWLELDRLLAEADVVSLHPTPPPGGGPLLDRARLARLGPRAVLVNTARGGLVDEAALYDQLAAGKLAGAYLDVFTDEPYDGPLRDLPQVLLTPHIGSYAVETRVRMESEAVDRLLAALAAESG